MYIRKNLLLQKSISNFYLTFLCLWCQNWSWLDWFSRCSLYSEDLRKTFARVLKMIFLKNFKKFTEKWFRWSSFLSNIVGLGRHINKKRTLTQVYFCAFYEISHYKFCIWALLVLEVIQTASFFTVLIIRAISNHFFVELYVDAWTIWNLISQYYTF